MKFRTVYIFNVIDILLNNRKRNVYASLNFWYFTNHKIYCRKYENMYDNNYLRKT